MHNFKTTGRLTRDAKLFKNEDGSKPRLLFTVAHNEAGANGFERTDFYDCILWGDRATKMAKWMLKGRLIEIEGYLETRPIRKDDGSFDHTEARVRVDSLIYLDKKPEGVEEPKTEGRDAVLAQFQKLVAEKPEMVAQLEALGIKLPKPEPKPEPKTDLVAQLAALLAEKSTETTAQSEPAQETQKTQEQPSLDAVLKALSGAEVENDEVPF
jgi:single-strand DNA-binding protein